MKKIFLVVILTYLFFNQLQAAESEVIDAFEDWKELPYFVSKPAVYNDLIKMINNEKNRDKNIDFLIKNGGLFAIISQLELFFESLTGCKNLLDTKIIIENNLMKE